MSTSYSSVQSFMFLLLFLVYKDVYFCASFLSKISYFISLSMWLEQRGWIKEWPSCIILTPSLTLLTEGKLGAAVILQQKPESSQFST